MADTTKVMITDDFYSEYEIYETTEPDDLREWAKSAYTAWENGETVPDLDETKHKIIGTMDNLIWLNEAKKMADIIIYTSDFE